MGKVLSKDGTTIVFDRTGEGPAVILVWGAGITRAFPPAIQLAELLAAQFTVVNYDRRGRGDSGDTAPYAVRREVEDLEALIDETGGSAFVYGHSSGATLALEYSTQSGRKDQETGALRATVYDRRKRCDRRLITWRNLKR